MVSSPDAGDGHPGGWLGPSQGWISPPSRSGSGCGKRGTGGRRGARPKYLSGPVRAWASRANLAAALAESSKVMLLDADAQGSSQDWAESQGQRRFNFEVQRAGDAGRPAPGGQAIGGRL